MGMMRTAESEKGRPLIISGISTELSYITGQ